MLGARAEHGLVRGDANAGGGVSESSDRTLGGDDARGLHDSAVGVGGRGVLGDRTGSGSGADASRRVSAPARSSARARAGGGGSDAGRARRRAGASRDRFDRSAFSTLPREKTASRCLRAASGAARTHPNVQEGERACGETESGPEQSLLTDDGHARRACVARGLPRRALYGSTDARGFGVEETRRFPGIHLTDRRVDFASLRGFGQTCGATPGPRARVPVQRDGDGATMALAARRHRPRAQEPVRGRSQRGGDEGRGVRHRGLRAPRRRGALPLSPCFDPSA